MPSNPCLFNAGKTKQVTLSKWIDEPENVSGLTKFEHAVIEFTKAFIAVDIERSSGELIVKKAVSQARAMFDYLESKDE